MAASKDGTADPSASRKAHRIGGRLRSRKRRRKAGKERTARSHGRQANAMLTADEGQEGRKAEEHLQEDV